MNRKVYTVSSVSQYIKNMFMNEYALSVVFVKGEISNCKYHSSGHIYFTIKDEGAQMSCVMFRGDRRGLDFAMENGQEVVVGGTINVYERDGKYQLYAKKIVLSGDGILAERYEKLKEQLKSRGYFDEDRKLPIPKYVRTVGIVTAKTGAALRDMMNICARRNPYVQLILYPAKVQGEGAKETIAEGIRCLDEKKVDVIIVGRGGGSIEDLWAFNEEAVANAIFECRTPVISAVGHETDFTISDFVADLRAPTPSAAMELAVYDVGQALDRLSDYKDRLARGMLLRMEQYSDRLEQMEYRLKIFNPQNRIRDQRQYLTDMEDKMIRMMEKILTEKKHEFAMLTSRLDSVSPLKKMESGYAYITDDRDRRVDSVKQLKRGDSVRIAMKDGTVVTTVDEVIETRETWN